MSRTQPKVNEPNYLAIKKAIESGASYKVIGAAFGVSPATVYNVKKSLSHKHYLMSIRRQKEKSLSGRDLPIRKEVQSKTPQFVNYSRQIPLEIFKYTQITICILSFIIAVLTLVLLGGIK